MARGKSGRGTSIGPMALTAGDMKARLAPKNTAMVKIGHSAWMPRTAMNSSTSTLTVSTPKVIMAMCLRLRRSAVSPAIRVSRNSGTNCARPIMLTMKADSPTDMVWRAMA